MPTPHISAEKGDFAPSILLPGDPLRAKHIADNFLDDAREVNAVRNMLGYTGSYKGLDVSVMGTGMGIPSASIYATELITEYGVERLIRVGSCGGVLSSVKIRDVVLAIGACTDSGVEPGRYAGLDFAATADFDLLRAAAEAAADRAYRQGGQRPLRRPLLQPRFSRLRPHGVDGRACGRDGGGGSLRGGRRARGTGPDHRNGLRPRARPESRPLRRSDRRLSMRWSRSPSTP